MKIGRRLTPVPWRPAIDRFLESTVSAGAVIRLLIPVLLYVCLHIAGWLAPDHLWGVDQLHYYSDWVGCVYVLACLGAVFMALRWGQKLDEVLSRILLSIRGSGVARAISALLAAVTFLVLAWVGQTREHYLGDSKAWLRYLELTVNPDSDFDVTRSIKSFAFPGWEHVPQAEPLDFLLHLWLYEWTIPYGWSAADAYASFSIAAGLVFGVVVWRIAGQLSHTTETRLTLTGLLLTLGTAQLFLATERAIRW